MLFILCYANAQNKFKYQTFTDSVVKDGFYQINLLPAIVAKCKPALDDMRLFDIGNKQVPYLIKNGETEWATLNNLQKASKNYFTIPQPIITQRDSANKFSYVNLIFNEPYKIGKLQLFMSGASFYERNVVFKDGYYDADKNPAIGIVSSKSNNTFFMNLFMKKEKVDTLNFTIQNNDNPPLKIDSVKAYQNAYALFAYLKAGQKYKLMFGNDSLAAPVYDISAFSDSIKNATLLPTNEITENQMAKTETKTTKSSLSKIWLWTAIISVLLLLLYFTSNMLKQINKR